MDCNGIITWDDRNKDHCNTFILITDNEGVKTVTSSPAGPLEDDMKLVVEPLVPMVLAENEFPVIGYLIEGTEEEEEGGAVESSSEDDEEAEAEKEEATAES